MRQARNHSFRNFPIAPEDSNNMKYTGSRILESYSKISSTGKKWPPLSTGRVCFCPVSV